MCLCLKWNILNIQHTSVPIWKYDMKYYGCNRKWKWNLICIYAQVFFPSFLVPTEPAVVISYPFFSTFRIGFWSYNFCLFCCVNKYKYFPNTFLISNIMLNFLLHFSSLTIYHEHIAFAKSYDTGGTDKIYYIIRV